MRRVFLDILNTFLKNCHKVLILTLNRDGISGNLLEVSRDFTKLKKKKISLINSQNFSWKGVNTVVPQGFMLFRFA